MLFLITILFGLNLKNSWSLDHMNRTRIVMSKTRWKMTICANMYSSWKLNTAMSAGSQLSWTKGFRNSWTNWSLFHIFLFRYSQYGVPENLGVNKKRWNGTSKKGTSFTKIGLGTPATLTKKKRSCARGMSEKQSINQKRRLYPDQFNNADRKISISSWTR